MEALPINARTGERKCIPVGFNWPAFLLLILVLMPLALGTSFALEWVVEIPRELAAVPFVVAGVLSQSLAGRANAMRARRLLLSGWTFVDPDNFGADFTHATAGLPSGAMSRPEPRSRFVLDEATFVAACAGACASRQPIYVSTEGAMKILMTNPRTSELKYVKVGWSWTLFFFTFFFGIPLFMRSLYGWGIFFLLLPIASTILLKGIRFPSEGAEMTAVTANWVIQIAMLVFIAMNGNAFTARALVKAGWTFAHPGTVETQYAQKKWQLEPNTPHAPSIPQI